LRRALLELALFLIKTVTALPEAHPPLSTTACNSFFISGESYHVPVVKAVTLSQFVPVVRDLLLKSVKVVGALGLSASSK
jgi:hypothetical protein